MKWLAFLCFTAAACAQIDWPLVPVPLRDGMIAHWRLEESSGVRFDSIGTNHLTANGTVIRTNANQFNGVALTGASGNYLSSTSTNLARLASSNFAVAVWFNQMSNLLNTDSRFIVARRSATATEFALDMQSNSINRLRWYVNNGSFQIVTFTNVIIPSNAWCLAIGSRQNTNLSIRVYAPNQRPASSNLLVSGNVQCCSPFKIGSAANDTAPDQWKGHIDSVTMWNRSLTTNEMDWLWNAGVGGLDYFTQ